MKKFLAAFLWKLLGAPPKVEAHEISLSVDCPEWHDGDAANWRAYLKSDDGRPLAQQMKKHQQDMQEWATDLSGGKHDEMKYRACIAFGVRIAHEKMLALATVQASKKPEKMTDAEVQRFIEKRMGIPMGAFKT